MNIHRITRKTILAAVACLAIPAAAVAAPAVIGSTSAPRTTSTATLAAASCPTGWGSLPEANNRMTQAPVTAVRTGRHACFDRLVVDIRGRVPGYDVRYVSNVFTDGAGHLVPLRGGAKLQLVVHAPSYDAAGRSTYNPATPRELSTVAGYSTFRQVALAGSFEGQTTFGVGVRARLPFRVFTLAGPGSNTRLVLDVAHHW
ncbi:hypothetical protein E0H75_18645 [Kribbella capetownensis]|uniref:AMIN-like domain-containing protein n=1 Tax=Kribbella capetownensis TaxID=1572659 RepID=A0A4R0JPB9_9ACTN|nr:hypothetical protein [Kribbella capetownensis]TCC48609.1 hypothetical protein E0H75_18645 [Kribbella capetownensis]